MGVECRAVGRFRRRDAVVAAVAAIDKSSIIVTAALATVLLGEVLTVRVIGGAVLLSAGLWLMTGRA